MKIFVVIPFCNEKKHLSSVLKSVSKYSLPIVVVDDGSKDGSGAEVKGLKIKDLTLLTHNVNLGKGAALKTGAEYAFNKGADAVIFMDSDGQHLATDLPKFLEVLKSGKYGVVFGSRNLGMGVPLVRYLGNKIASVFSAALFKVYVSDATCGFRALTRNGYEKIKWESEGYGVEIEMVARVGKYNVKHLEVPVETVYLDDVKGVTLFDAFGILGEVVKWKLTL
jgi:glycosyltransferase involved in cell wall biosynthesis